MKRKRSPKYKKKLNIRTATIIRAVVSFVILVIIAVSGILITLRIANFQKKQYFEVRKYQAAAAAASLDYREVESLKGSEEDTSSEVFRKLNDVLNRVKETDPRIRFVYLMRPDANGEMVFLVDAEDPKSKDYSPPGQVYYEALPEEFEPFNGKKNPSPFIVGPVTDRWGTWISADAFVLNDKNEPVALLGTDVDVETALSSFNQIRYLGIVFTVVAVILAALVLAQLIIWRYNRDKRLAAREREEEALLLLNRKLMETDTLKDEFIQSASHELRAPVTALTIALSQLSSQLEIAGDAGVKRILEIAVTGADRLRELIDDLLDLTRIEGGGIKAESEELDIEVLAGEIKKEFESMVKEKSLGYEFEIAGGNRVISADPKLLRRILENLLSNAIKYTESGKITVRIDTAGDPVLFTIEDTGPGIPEEFREDVFKRFSSLHLSTDSNKRGTGLGLAISKGLVEAMGGRIWFESKPGGGTKFYFEVPR